MSRLRVHSVGMSLDGYAVDKLKGGLLLRLSPVGPPLLDWPEKLDELLAVVPKIDSTIQDALTQARKAAQGKDIRLGGGVATIQEYLRAGLVDEMHLAYAPVLLGSGECLLAGIDLPALGYHVDAHRNSANCLHVRIAKTGM